MAPPTHMNQPRDKALGCACPKITICCSISCIQRRDQSQLAISHVIMHHASCCVSHTGRETRSKTIIWWCSSCMQGFASGHRLNAPRAAGRKQGAGWLALRHGVSSAVGSFEPVLKRKISYPIWKFSLRSKISGGGATRLADVCQRGSSADTVIKLSFFASLRRGAGRRW